MLQFKVVKVKSNGLESEEFEMFQSESYEDLCEQLYAGPCGEAYNIYFDGKLISGSIQEEQTIKEKYISCAKQSIANEMANEMAFLLEAIMRMQYRDVEISDAILASVQDCLKRWKEANK